MVALNIVKVGKISRKMKQLALPSRSYIIVDHEMGKEAE